jgi:hypothetical protein
MMWQASATPSRCMNLDTPGPTGLDRTGEAWCSWTPHLCKKHIGARWLCHEVAFDCCDWWRLSCLKFKMHATWPGGRQCLSIVTTPPTRRRNRYWTDRGRLLPNPRGPNRDVQRRMWRLCRGAAVGGKTGHHTCPRASSPRREQAAAVYARTRNVTVIRRLCSNGFPACIETKTAQTTVLNRPGGNAKLEQMKR